jgi:hypothetical protein
LRTHARYRRSDGDEPIAKKAVDPGLIRIREAFPAESGSGLCARSQAAFGNKAGTPHEADPVAHEVHERDLKRSSITVRLSATECAQLHQRANEAGLTVSGYLRSCTFEAEALRAQVKEALAELRTGGSKPDEAGPALVRRSLFQRCLVPFAHWHRKQRAAQV